MIRSFRLLSTGSLLLAVPAVLHAQDAPQEEGGEENASANQIVVIGYGRSEEPTAATGLPLTPIETPQTVSVVTQ
ncbi:MAG TPA: hypothetical protein VGA34_04045, partial [Alteraurantiacibacter sp.]